MAKEFTMPKLGHLMEEATVVSWKKIAGDSVEKGEIILEIEAEKGILEAECSLSGTLCEILVAEGQTVPVGTPLALIEEAR